MRCNWLLIHLNRYISRRSVEHFFEIIRWSNLTYPNRLSFLFRGLSDVSREWPCRPHGLPKQYLGEIAFLPMSMWSLMRRYLPLLSVKACLVCLDIWLLVMLWAFPSRNGHSPAPWLSQGPINGSVWVIPCIMTWNLPKSMGCRSWLESFICVSRLESFIAFSFISLPCNPRWPKPTKPHPTEEKGLWFAHRSHVWSVIPWA
jgi:hypothetical protein